MHISSVLDSRLLESALVCISIHYALFSQTKIDNVKQKRIQNFCRSSERYYVASFISDASSAFLLNIKRCYSTFIDELFSTYTYINQIENEKKRELEN